MLETIYQVLVVGVVILHSLRAALTEDPTGKTHSLLWAILLLLVLINREVLYP